MALRILALTSHDIEAPDFGAAIRARCIFQQLAKFGTVHVVVAGYKGTVPGVVRSQHPGLGIVERMLPHRVRNRSLVERWRCELDPRFLNTHKAQAAPADRDRLLSLIADHDLVWIHGLRPANIFGLYRWPRSVLDIDDLPSSYHRTQRKQASPSRKLHYLRKEWLWRRRERTLRERFDALCVTSEPDRALLPDLDRVFVLPNGFTAPRDPPTHSPASPPRIGFVGLLGYPPNSDGLRWFVEHVWPLVRHACPEARLRVAGSGSDQLYPSGRDNIDGLGWVADVGAEMATWSLSIVPLFVGGGTRIKIAEALARRCPVVSTSLGAYGYDLEAGREIEIADTPDRFAARCLALLADPGAAERMADQGWQQFLAHWTWDAQYDRIAQIVAATRS